MQNAFTSETMPLLIILVGAVFVHACFQLSVSVLTRLSSHTIGRGKSPQKLLKLSLAYVVGVIIATTSIGLAMSVFFVWLASYDLRWPTFVVIGLLPVVGLLVMGFYYRRDRGTRLWLPRPIIDYLMDRAKKTHSATEASMLGIATVVGELPFIIAPVSIVALWVSAIVPVPNWLELSIAYAVIVSLPLVFLTLYLSSGHKLSTVQNWRERNKSFLQWTSGIALILLDVYLVSYVVWSTS